MTKTFMIAAVTVALATIGSACAPKKQQAHAAGGGAAADGTGQKAMPLHPLTLSVEGTKAGDGSIELVVKVTVNGKLPADPVLQVTLPPGALLAAGQAAETLAGAAAGSVIERRYTVTGAAGTIHVAVDAVGPSSGAHADADFPRAAPVAGAPSTAAVPITPVVVHGVTIDSAVPVKGK